MKTLDTRDRTVIISHHSIRQISSEITTQNHQLSTKKTPQYHQRQQQRHEHRQGAGRKTKQQGQKPEYPDTLHLLIHEFLYIDICMGVYTEPGRTIIRPNYIILQSYSKPT